MIVNVEERVVFKCQYVRTQKHFETEEEHEVGGVYKGDRGKYKCYASFLKMIITERCDNGREATYTRSFG